MAGRAGRQRDRGAGPGRGQSKGGPSTSGKSSGGHKGFKSASSPQMAKAMQAKFDRPVARHEYKQERELREKREQMEQRRANPQVPEGWSTPRGPQKEKEEKAQRESLARARQAYGPPKEVKTSRVTRSPSFAAKERAMNRAKERAMQGLRDRMGRRSRGEREA